MFKPIGPVIITLPGQTQILIERADHCPATLQNEGDFLLASRMTSLYDLIRKGILRGNRADTSRFTGQVSADGIMMPGAY